MSLPIPTAAQYRMNTNFPNCHILPIKRNDPFLLRSPKTVSQRTVQDVDIQALCQICVASIFNAK